MNRLFDQCFDCHLNSNTCLNWSSCNDNTGKCDCDAGFGGPDCSKVQCGSLGRTNRPLRPENQSSCDCDDGWTGINCNVCNRDSVCDALNPTGMNGTCYNSMLPVKKSNLMCDVTNSAIKSLLKERTPQLTLSCEKDDLRCHFEFWAGGQESFFCNLNECNFSKDYALQKNVTSVNCPKVQCKCFPGRLLCGEGDSLDLTEWFESSEGPTGPGSFICDEFTDSNGLFHRDCKFTEDNMNTLISQFFGDPSITLSCRTGGECMHYSQIPGYGGPRFEQGFPLPIIVTISFVSLALVLLAFFGLKIVRSRTDGSGYSPVDNEDEDELQRRQDMMSNHVPCTIAFRNTCYTIETDKKVGSDGAKMKQIILEGIQGIVRPGEVMAIMGGSGAGKSTLLDILARKNKEGIVTGDILVNDCFMEYDKYRNIIGYVDQEDTLMDTLTVYETIMYSALLRLPRSMTAATKRKRVQETMLELGISGIANKRIGSAGRRGLSGGEKRRVSIACELVTSPSILFLDEPTSGLDSYNAYNVIECLVGLARDYHRSVILTIHQPRSNIYALFDSLVLLSKGRVVYSGPAQQPVIDHFASLGFECPMGFNIADYLVDLTMHAANSTVSLAAEGLSVSIPPRANIRAVQESLLYSPRSPTSEGPSSSSSPKRPIDPDLITEEQRAVRVSGVAQSMTIVDLGLMKPYVSDELSVLIRGYEMSAIGKKIKSDMTDAIGSSYSSSNPVDIEHLRAHSRQRGSLSIRTSVTMMYQSINSNNRTGAHFIDQLSILSGRTMRNLYRNPDLLKTHYLISVLVAFICGFLFWQVNNTLSGFQNRLGVMFFICALFGFGCLSSMQAFASERLIFLRERANRYYSPITYFISKIVFDIVPLRVIPPIILGLICYHMVGLQPQLDLLARFLLVLVLFNVTSAACCLAISIIFTDQGVASLVATLVMLFEMLFGGLLLNKNTIPIQFQWMTRLSFFNYAFEALVVNEVSKLTLVEEKFGFKIDVPGALVLQTFGLNAQGYWDDVKALAIMCTFFLFSAFLWLQFFVRERR